MNAVTVLGASGSGGGGGSGNAVQDINNYLNRLNGSTFGYFSALVPAVSVEDFVDSNSTAGVAAAGVNLTAGLSLLTTNLIDPEFIEDVLIPERVEIEAIWAQSTEFPITTQIDPNARWSISFNASDTTAQFTTVTPVSTKNVVGVITSAGVLVGTNLTNAPLTQIDTFFVENHGFSTGHKVSLTTAGGLTLTDATDVYVHSITVDSFALYDTVANADLGGSTGRIEISASTLGSPIFTRGAGIIPRIGHTNTSRVIFDQRNVTLTGGAYSTTSSPSVRLFVTGDSDAATGSPAALMTSTALFYADQLGIEGVNPNGLDDLNDMIRGSHLINPVNANASYGANGRGVILLDGSGTQREIAFNSSGQLIKLDANAANPVIVEPSAIDLFNDSVSGDFSTVIPNSIGDTTSGADRITSLATFEADKVTSVNNISIRFTNDIQSTGTAGIFNIRLQRSTNPGGFATGNADTGWTDIAGSTISFAEGVATATTTNTLSGISLSANEFIRIRVTAFKTTQGSFHVRVQGNETL